MHMAMKVVNGGQVVLQVLSVLVAIGALIAFIAASVKGTTNGVIAGGYIAALWCLAVNIYTLIAWRVTRKRPNPPKWAIKNIVALCLLHIFTAVLTIGCSVALSLVEICNHWDNDDEDDDEDDNGLNRCERRTFPMYVGGGLLIALFVFHLIFSIVSCINMCYRKGSKKDRRGQHQPVPTQETTAYAPGPYAPPAQASTPYAPVQQQTYAPMQYSSQTQGSPLDARAQGTPYTPSPQTEYSSTHHNQQTQEAYAQPPSRELSSIDHAAPVTTTTYTAGSQSAPVELPHTEHTDVSTQGRTELA